MITVVNKHHPLHTIPGLQWYIGRGSVLSNPFSHLRGTKAQILVPTRQDAINSYKGWLIQKIVDGDKKILQELTNLIQKAREGDLLLVCYCAPKPCHGDVIKKLIERQLHEEKDEIQKT